MTSILNGLTLMFCWAPGDPGPPLTAQNICFISLILNNFS